MAASQLLHKAPHAYRQMVLDCVSASLRVDGQCRKYSIDMFVYILTYLQLGWLLTKVMISIQLPQVLLPLHCPPTYHPCNSPSLSHMMITSSYGRTSLPPYHLHPNKMAQVGPFSINHRICHVFMPQVRELVPQYADLGPKKETYHINYTSQ